MSAVPMALESSSGLSAHTLHASKQCKQCEEPDNWRSEGDEERYNPEYQNG